MSSLEKTRDEAFKTPCKQEPHYSADSDGEEPTNLVINIKEEPVDEEYYEEGHNNGETSDDPGAHPLDNDGGSAPESESDYYKEINLPQAVVTQKLESDTPQTRVVISPCISPPVPNGKSIRPFKSGQDLTRVTPPPTLTSTRFVPVKVKTSGPIPIALTLSKPEVDPTTNPLLNSQAQAHHLMTLATEADKILKKQEKRLQGEQRSNLSPGCNIEENDSNDEEDNMCSSSDSSNGGLDSFLNSNDPTLTLIQRRAAEASISSAKKSKRKRSQLPDDMKDDTYWERRRKNNEAAKRSRDARRAKEDQIAIRAALLEQENMRLRIEVAALKDETVRLKGMLYESQK